MILDFLAKQQLQIVEVASNTIIADVGQECISLIILISGRVKVYKDSADGRSLTLYHILPKQSCVLTASCLMNKKPFNATAVTEENCKGYVVPESKMILWQRTEPEWQQFMFKTLATRMDELINKVDQIAFSSLEDRLYGWLEQQVDNKVINITHQEIAEELASSREVVSRLLKKFEQKQYIQQQRGKITILM